MSIEYWIGSLFAIFCYIIYAQYMEIRKLKGYLKRSKDLRPTHFEQMMMGHKYPTIRLTQIRPDGKKVIDHDASTS